MHSVYDYKRHVNLSESIQERGKLSSTFMMLQPQSHVDHVWTDVHHFRGLNAEQLRKGAETHICPLPFDIVERLIGRYTNAPREKDGQTIREIVFDPFGGIMTVPYCAIKMGRVGKACELSEEYWRCGVEYLKAEEYRQTVPTLFDLIS